MVQFTPGMTRVCLPDPHVTLNSDSELEETEQLRLRLDTDEERVNLDPEVTVINIQDGEGWWINHTKIIYCTLLFFVCVNYIITS